MNRFKLIFLVSISFAMLMSCKSTPEGVYHSLTEPFTIKIDPNTISANGPKMSDVFSGVEYVKLELSEKSLVGDISEISCNDDYIFVKSPQTKELLQFARNGKFIRVVGRIGRGPGEYLAIRNFSIDDFNKRVVILDNFGLNLYFYDFDGNHVATKEIHFADGSSLIDNPFTYMTTLDKQHILIEVNTGMRYVHKPLNEDNYKVYYIVDSSNGEIVFEQESDLYDKQRYKINADRSNYIPFVHSIWMDEQGRLNYWEYASDTVKVLKSDFSFEPRIFFEHSSLTPNLSDLTNLGGYNYYVDLPGKVIKQSVYETPKYIFTNWLYKNKYYTSAFDKKNGEESICNVIPADGKASAVYRMAIAQGGPLNDIDGVFGDKPAKMQIDCWIYTINALKMKETITDEFLNKTEVKDPDKKRVLREFVSMLDEEDNPVVIIATLSR